VHKVQVLIYRLQTQNTTVTRLSRSVDDAHAEVNQLKNERDNLDADIKQHEDFVNSNLNASGDRKAVGDALPGLKDRLASLDDQLQQAQKEESTAQSSCSPRGPSSIVSRLNSTVSKKALRRTTTRPPKIRSSADRSPDMPIFEVVLMGWRDPI